MKKLFTLMLITIILVLFVGCSDENDNDDNNEPPTGIDFTNDNWSDVIDYYLIVDTYIEIMSKIEVESCVLIIDGITINADNWEYDGDREFLFPWYCEIEPEDLPEGVDLSTGNQLDIYLNINTHQYQGDLSIPYNINANFPEFNKNEDYFFNWSLPLDTITQVVSISFGDYNSGIDVYEYYQIDSGIRDYTIYSSTYSSISGSEEFWVEIGIDAINYVDLDKCVFLSSSGDYYEEGIEDTKSDKRIRLLEAVSSN